jgi:hypothetical protein
VRPIPKILAVAKLTFRVIVDRFLDRFDPNITARLSRDPMCLFCTRAEPAHFPQRGEKLRWVFVVVPKVGIDHGRH